jgi:GT2 family glycosyltransferase
MRALARKLRAWKFAATEAPGRSVPKQLCSVTGTVVGAVRVLSCTLVHDPRRALHLVERSYRVLQRNGLPALLSTIRRYLAAQPTSALEGSEEYQQWVAAYDTLNQQDEAAIAKMMGQLRVRPLVTVITAVPEPAGATVDGLLATLISQLYPDWELCLTACGGTALEETAAAIQRAGNDSRIRLVPQAVAEPAAALNAALESASGDYCAILESWDRLAPHALFLVAHRLNAEPVCDLLYGDHDRLDERGVRTRPCFKPDYSPHLLGCTNYIGPFSVVRTALLRELGGWRAESQPAQHYDLLLRITESGPAVGHIPHVLCHLGAPDGAAGQPSLDMTALSAAEALALECHLGRVGLGQWTVGANGNGIYRIVPSVEEDWPKVSVIIPTRDNGKVLRTCVTSLLEITDYPNLEILVVDNGSQDPATRDYLRQLGEQDIRVLEYEQPFNFSAINNFATEHATGELLCLLNDDTEVVSRGWLREMAGYAVRPEVGAVGAMLLYADGTVQHAGVVLGIGGVAGHVFRGMAPHSEAAFGSLDAVRNFSAVTAACLVLRRSVYWEVGGLDEDLAVIFNDVDFCLRIRDKGYRIVWTPHAVLRHYESQSRNQDVTPASAGRLWDEALAMHARWGAALEMDPFYNPNLTLLRITAGLAFPPRWSCPWNRTGTVAHFAQPGETSRLRGQSGQGKRLARFR